MFGISVKRLSNAKIYERAIAQNLAGKTKKFEGGTAKIMKTRENELHEPKINKSFFCTDCEYGEYEEIQYVIEIKCSVCGKLLTGTRFVDSSPEKRDYFEKIELGKIPNYCPRCGARLKEIKE